MHSNKIGGHSTKAAIPPLTAHSGLAETDEAKAEAIADSLGIQFTPNIYTDPGQVEISRQSEEQFARKISEGLSNIPPNEVDHATPHELLKYIHKIKTKKSPVLDRISNRIL